METIDRPIVPKTESQLPSLLVVLLLGASVAGAIREVVQRGYDLMPWWISGTLIAAGAGLTLKLAASLVRNWRQLLIELGRLLGTIGMALAITALVGILAVIILLLRANWQVTTGGLTVLLLYLIWMQLVRQNDRR